MKQEINNLIYKDARNLIHKLLSLKSWILKMPFIVFSFTEFSILIYERKQGYRVVAMETKRFLIAPTSWSNSVDSTIWLPDPTDVSAVNSTTKNNCDF